MSILKQKLFAEVKDFAQKNLEDSNCFSCIYGSYATGDHTTLSDLDMFVAMNEYNMDFYQKLESFLTNLHVHNNLKIDDEVPYKNKLLVTYEDVQHSIDLHPFILEGGIKYSVPNIAKTSTFLSSPEMRWRLILQALTSPHIYIGGDAKTYKEYLQKAEKSLIKLARNICIVTSPKPIDILNTLLISQDGYHDEMYLGYKKERKSVVSHLESLIYRNLSIEEL